MLQLGFRNFSDTILDGILMRNAGKCCRCSVVLLCFANTSRCGVDAKPLESHIQKVITGDKSYRRDDVSNEILRVLSRVRC